MAAEDWLPVEDDYFFDHLDYVNDGFYFPKPKPPYRFTCKYCGKTMLKWVQVDKKWKLFDIKGIQHKCQS